MSEESCWRGDYALFQTTDGDWRVLDISRINSDYDETLYWGPSKEEAQRIFDEATLPFKPTSPAPDKRIRP